MGFLIIIVIGGVFAIILASVSIHSQGKQEKNEFNNFVSQRSKLAEDLAEDFKLIGWGHWGMGAHLTDEQAIRMKRAAESRSMELLGYDLDTHRACVQGEHGVPYDIDEFGCSCPDFAKRQLPCKHIYFVFLQLIGDGKETVSNMEKQFASMSGWDIWDPSIHKASGQFERMQLATLNGKITILSYDPDYKFAKVQDGGHVYLTSCNRCSCADYRNRKLPCKHMYALAIKLDGDVEKCIVDDKHAPLYGLKFTLVGHFQRKSKNYSGIREKIAELGGVCEKEPSYYTSAIILGSDPSEARKAMVESSDFEVLSPESIEKLFITKEDEENNKT